MKYPDYNEMAKAITFYIESGNKDLVADELKLLFTRGYYLGKREASDMNNNYRVSEEDWQAWEQEFDISKKGGSTS